MAVAAWTSLGDGQIAIGAVWNHRLTRFKMKLLPSSRDNIRLDLLLDVSTAPRMVDITKLHTTLHIAVAPVASFTDLRHVSRLSSNVSQDHPPADFPIPMSGL